MEECTGLRERKKAATRLALHEAALSLAVEHGPDRITVEAIADAANVSRRTFSNYFGGKEEALFHGDTLRLRRLLRLVADQPAELSPWAALTRAAWSRPRTATTTRPSRGSTGVAGCTATRAWPPTRSARTPVGGDETRGAGPPADRTGRGVAGPDRRRDVPRPRGSPPTSGWSTRGGRCATCCATCSPWPPRRRAERAACPSDRWNGRRKRHPA
ncbi:TetR/AcrR family transcriptional regulator [Micromonospora sp. BRA006-A]|nr:TetR/AcrR family transcriptional regulator [Micromonospora sp. BRA006-A]